MTRQDLFNTLKSTAAGLYEPSEAQAVAERLCEALYGFSRFELSLEPDMELPTPQLAEHLERLGAGEPVQYIIGSSEFYSRTFRVAEGVLIPRPETEELVALIVRQLSTPSPRILDIGTGSGAIAITLAAEIAGAQVEALDLSSKALGIARSNAELLGQAVGFVEADIFEWQPSPDSYDIIVSNPPYIPLSERENMHLNVVDYEPSMALFVPDNDPLIFYRRIAEVARRALSDGGRLYFEIHERLADQTAQMLSSAGFEDVTIHNDFFSKPRMIACTKRG